MKAYAQERGELPVEVELGEGGKPAQGVEAEITIEIAIDVVSNPDEAILVTPKCVGTGDDFLLTV